LCSCVVVAVAAVVVDDVSIHNIIWYKYTPFGRNILPRLTVSIFLAWFTLAVLHSQV
jgi:hypothetical protein